MVVLGYIVANKAIMERGEPVGYLYREEPDSDNDSGWRVFTGNETQAEADDARNFAMYNATTLVSLAPGIASLLGFPAPIAFEKTEDGTFVEVAEAE